MEQKIEYPHHIGCPCCKDAARCNWCGSSVAGLGCSNGRCANCCDVRCLGSNSHRLLRKLKEYKVAAILVLVVAMVYGGHMLYRYLKIRQDSTKRAAEIVQPIVHDDDVTEVGYIYSMRNEIFLRDENRVNLVWFVKVPATGARYSCGYEYGFPDFRTGDDVKIIRPREVVDNSGPGYVIGLHGKLSGQIASVWVNDEDELEMDAGPDPE
jgi:hypothetical protein